MRSENVWSYSLVYIVRQFISLNCRFHWCLCSGRDLHLDILMFCLFYINKINLFLCGMEVTLLICSKQKHISFSLSIIVLKFLTFQVMPVIVLFVFVSVWVIMHVMWWWMPHVEDVILAWHDRPLLDDLFIYSCLFLPYNTLPGIH